MVLPISWVTPSPATPSAQHHGQDSGVVRLLVALRQCLRALPATSGGHVSERKVLPGRGPLAPIWMPDPPLQLREPRELLGAPKPLGGEPIVEGLRLKRRAPPCQTPALRRVGPRVAVGYVRCLGRRHPKFRAARKVGRVGRALDAEYLSCPDSSSSRTRARLLPKAPRFIGLVLLPYTRLPEQLQHLPRRGVGARHGIRPVSLPRLRRCIGYLVRLTKPRRK